MGNSYKLKIDSLVFLSTLSLPADGIQVIEDICNLFGERNRANQKRSIIKYLN